MKVLILTLGTRGDVQPFIALARQLRHSGHEVVLAAPLRFRDLVTAHGVTFAPIADGPLTLVDSGSPVGDVSEGGLRAKLILAKKMPGLYHDVFRDCWDVASSGLGAGADLIVHNGQILAGQHVAEKLGVPTVLALPFPLYVPTGEFPWPVRDFPRRLPSVVNRASFYGMKGMELMFARTADRWRSSHGMRRRSGRHNPLRRPDGTPAPVMHAVGSATLPQPHDWPDTVTTTGYWFLEDTLSAEETSREASLPQSLLDFLDAGEAPVYIGFGSMSGSDPAATTRHVLDAVERTGSRVVLAKGWGGLNAEQASDSVYLLDGAPHHLLFPRMRMIVHHGGAGTTAAAVAAGRPQVICPFVADQPFWGRRMHTLGVAPAPVPQRRLTGESLARAIEQVKADSSFEAAAARLGEKTRAECGVKTAVARLEAVMADKAGKHHV